MEAFGARVETTELDDASTRTSLARPGSRDNALRRLLAVGDGVAVAGAVLIALSVPLSRPGGHSLLWSLPAIPLMIVLFKLYGLYDRDVKRITYSTVDDL